MIQNQWALEDLLHMEYTFLSVRTRQSTLQCSWAPGGRMGVWLIGWTLGIWIQYQVLTWPVLPIPIPVILLDIFYSACFRCMFSFPKTLFDTIQWTTSWTLRLETKYWSYLVSIDLIPIPVLVSILTMLGLIRQPLQVGWPLALPVCMLKYLLTSCLHIIQWSMCEDLAQSILKA